MTEEAKTPEQRIDRLEWANEQFAKDLAKIADETKEVLKMIFSKLDAITNGQTPGCLEHSREINELQSDLKQLKKVVYGCAAEGLSGLVEQLSTIQLRFKILIGVCIFLAAPLGIAAVHWLFPHIKW